MDRLKKLISCCKCNVSVEVNEHRNYYESVEQFLENREALTDDTASEVRQKMIETDTVICVQFYPHTPVGSYIVYHYDLDAALDEALECIGEVEG